MSAKPPPVSASATFHRVIQRAGRLFGGRHGRHPAWIEPESRTVDISPLRMHTLIWPGPLPALVLLHGLNNNAWSWARVASLLCSDRMVVAVDLRGHGSSSAPPEGYDLETTARDLANVLDALGIDVVDLAGHSWGGKVATCFAVHWPDRVRTLSLADPVPPRGLNPVIRTFPVLTTLSLRAERGPFPDRKTWEAAGQSVIYLRSWDLLDQRLWAAGFSEKEDGSFHHVLPEHAFDHVLTHALARNLEPRLQRLAAPVFLLRPTFTLSFLPGELASMRRALPQMVERRVPGDHTFIHTNPLDTADAMRPPWALDQIGRAHV